MQYDDAYMEVVFYEWQYGTGGISFFSKVWLFSDWMEERILSVGTLLKNNLYAEGAMSDI